MNYNIATAPLANADSLLPTDVAIADSRFALNYFRLSADKRLIFGGGERYSQTPPRDIAAFVRPFMAQVFPQIADAKIDYGWGGAVAVRSEEHTSELQSLMRISYAVFCLKKKTQ